MVGGKVGHFQITFIVMSIVIDLRGGTTGAFSPVVCVSAVAGAVPVAVAVAISVPVAGAGAVAVAGAGRVLVVTE